MANIPEILAASMLGEDADWEFKSSKGGFPGSFWHTYSAMANSEGGTVLFGVTENDGGVQLDGLTPDQIAKYKKILWDGLNNRGQVSRNLLSSGDVRAVSVGSDGGSVTLLAISIPRATRVERPIYVGASPLGGTYRRSHEGDYRCTDEQVRRMFADASPEPKDARILTGFTLTDLDAPTIAQYRQRMRTARGDHPWLSLGDQELLEQLGAWRQDRTTGQSGLTLAGILMFGKDGAIRDPAAAPNYFVDFRERLDPAVRWTDRIYPDGTWQANLLQFYQRVWPRLAAALPTPFALEGGMRRDDTEAHVALREALVNALIHADYTAPGGLVIEREPEQITIENPGTILVSMQQYRRGGVSECRNKSIQKMLLLIGGGEQAGSGAARIRAGWQSRAWRAPWIEAFSEPDRVRLTLPMVSLIPDATIDSLRRRFGTAQVDALAASEVQALATAALEGTVSNARLQSLIGEHPSDITQMLQRLCDRGLLKSDNRRRWTSYALANNEERRQGLDDSPRLEPSSPRLEPNSPRLEPNSPRPAQTPQTAGPEPDLPTTSDQWSSETSQFDPTQDPALRTIADPVASTRNAPQELVEDVIVSLCRNGPLTGQQIARLIRRNPRRVRDVFLSKLLKEARLKMRFPETPNSPNQAYLAEAPR